MNHYDELAHGYPKYLYAADIELSHVPWMSAGLKLIMNAWNGAAPRGDLLDAGLKRRPSSKLTPK